MENVQLRMVQNQIIVLQMTAMEERLSTTAMNYENQKSCQTYSSSSPATCVSCSPHRATEIASPLHCI